MRIWICQARAGSREASTTTVGLDSSALRRATPSPIALPGLAASLDRDYEGCHVSTLRRKFFNRPGRLYLTPEALIVYLDPFAEQDALLPEIDRVNAKRHRIPWLDNRLLVISVAPDDRGPGP